MQDLIKIFDVMSCHVARRNVNSCFLEVLQHENKDTREKRLKILPNLLFYQFISKLFASRSALCHLSMTIDYIKF